VAVLKQLLGEIRTGEFGPSSYLQMMGLLQTLVSDHGAYFERNSSDVTEIFLWVPHSGLDMLLFDSFKRNYLSILVIVDPHPQPHFKKNKIYHGRIRSHESLAPISASIDNTTRPRRIMDFSIKLEAGVCKY
jgi:hypothetical protein